MAMEAHNLRFVRCPKCHQLLVEYPSIPVYKCGGCGTVLRAKHRAVPVPQAGSQSVEGFPCSLKGSPQNSESLCSGEQKAVSSVDQPREATAHGSISSTVNDMDSRVSKIHERSVSVDDSVTHAEHPNEETCSLTDGKIQNSRTVVKEIHDNDTGADSGSNLTEKVEISYASENANGGRVDDVGTSDMGITLYEKDEVVCREERLYTYEGVHVESHKALIDELERSLSFSSDDDYFLDEAENSGLSDALRNQMGSRRFMLGSQMNDAPRSDPHGRLIEELEMSFSDAEEPLEQPAVVADGNAHDKGPQILGVKSAHPCEESLSSFDNGHLNIEQSSHQDKKLVGNGDEVKGYIEDDSNTAKHIVIANDETAERFHEKEHSKDWQSGNTESAYPCEASTSSVDDGSIKIEQSFQPNDLTADATQEMEEVCMKDDNTTNHIHGNENLVLADEGIAERVRGNEQPAANDPQEMKEGCMEDDDMANFVHGNDNLVLAGENIAEIVHGSEEQTADGTQEKEHCVHRNDNLVIADQGIAESVHGNEEIADGIQEIEDDKMTNCVRSNDSLVLENKHIVERAHGNEETGDDTGENEESCIKNENKTAGIADEDISKKVHENVDCTDQRSLEAEGTHLCEGVISSLSAGHVKYEQNFQQDETTADGTEEKEEDYTEDGNMTSHVQENSAAVARFSSLPNKRTQCKLASFNKNKQQMTRRCRGSQLHQGRSLDSGDFNSIQHYMESQMDGTSTSVSSGSPSQGDLMPRTANRFNNIVRHERLKKMDELRDQLSRLSSQKGSERSFQNRGLEYQQLSNSYDVEQHLQSVDCDSIPSSCALELYYGHGRPQRYQPPNPFSPTRANAHLHFGHAQTRLPQNYDPWEFNSYYQPSYAESTLIDHESLVSSYKEQRRVVRKHILRPVSGASPFTICSSCFNLVQMPSDIYISKSKVGKMQCGKCSKVLALSFPAVHNADAKTKEDVAQESYGCGESIAAKNEDIASYYAECLTGGPVSMTEDYGASNSRTRSLPAQAGPSSLAATQSGKKVSESALHRLMGYESASQLLRHSRVFEDGYESFESMVPVSSRVSRRKNT